LRKYSSEARRRSPVFFRKYLFFAIFIDHDFEQTADGVHLLGRQEIDESVGTAFRDLVRAALEQSPPAGLGQWDGPAIAGKLGAHIRGVAGAAP
jgi:hypothetical protein